LNLNRQGWPSLAMIGQSHWVKTPDTMLVQFERNVSLEFQRKKKKQHSTKESTTMRPTNPNHMKLPEVECTKNP
jgi:hypothetical protein